MVLSQEVESYRFWEVVAQWAAEKLQHEHVVARLLARATMRDGLRVQSVDPFWSKPGTFELRGTPLVGYVAREGALPTIIRATALEHLRKVVEIAAKPDQQFLSEEFIAKHDFAAWLRRSHIPAPMFWFANGDANEG
jgi:hypothetical protein